MVPQLKKEKCDSCLKSISLGQSITECTNCTKIVIHTKCFKKSKFKNINGKFFCPECSGAIVIRYNPFKELMHDTLCDNEELHQVQNSNIGNYSDDLTEANRVLENCTNLSVSSLKCIISEEHNLNSYFYNIDGNKSNFDTFASEIARFDEKFLIIGLAETNVEAQHKDLYKRQFGNIPLQRPHTVDARLAHTWHTIDTRLAHHAPLAHVSWHTVDARLAHG